MLFMGTCIVCDAGYLLFILCFLPRSEFPVSSLIHSAVGVLDVFLLARVKVKKMEVKWT